MTNPKDAPNAPTREARARKRRSIVIALGLAAFVIIVYVVTIVRMGGDVALRTF